MTVEGGPYGTRGVSPDVTSRNVSRRATWSLNLKAADNGRTSSDLLSVCLTLHSDTYLISHPPTSPRERQVVSYSHVYMCVSAVIT